MHFDHHAGLGELGTLGRSIPVHAAADNGRTGDPAIGAESIASAIRQRYGHAREFSIREHAALEPFDTCGFRVTLIPVRHGDLACFGVRVEDTETNSEVAISGDTDYAIDERSREVFGDLDLFVAEASVPARVSESVPSGRQPTLEFDGEHYDEAGGPRSVARGHMTREGALALAADIGARRTRLVHASHFYPIAEAFREPLATDGERHVL